MDGQGRPPGPTPGRLTTVSIYKDDLDELKRMQLQVSASRGKLTPIPEVVREIIATINRIGEEG